MGNYPIQPKYEPLWRAMEETGVVYGMHPFPAFGTLKPPGYTEQYSGAELIGRTVFTSGLPHFFLTKCAKLPGRSRPLGHHDVNVRLL